jgi:hypothetical protein
MLNQIKSLTEGIRNIIPNKSPDTVVELSQSYIDTMKQSRDNFESLVSTPDRTIAENSFEAPTVEHPKGIKQSSKVIIAKIFDGSNSLIPVDKYNPSQYYDGRNTAARDIFNLLPEPQEKIIIPNLEPLAKANPIPQKKERKNSIFNKAGRIINNVVSLDKVPVIDKNELRDDEIHSAQLAKLELLLRNQK